MRTIFILIVAIASTMSLLAQNDERVIRIVETDGYGQLWEKIQTEYESIDSLVVKGPISQSDFDAMWKASFYGRLEGIDLSKALPENEIIPEAAFYNDELQDVKMDGDPLPHFTPIKLKYITLPENLKSIGVAAFFRSPIIDITLPGTLRNIGAHAFAYCAYLNCDPLIIPEGVEDIPSFCFNLAQSIKRIVLPTSIKTIQKGAFMEAYSLEDVEMQPGIETIEDGVFTGCYALQRIILPNTVTTFGDDNFMYLGKLEELVLSDALTQIDFRCSSGGLRSLKRLVLPKYVESIGGDAFEWCPELEYLIFPETLKELSTFDVMPKLKEVYALGKTPASASENVFNTLPDDATLYVPIGTSELYRNATGWKNFSKIIEIEDTPGVGVKDISVDAWEDGRMYDVMGREIRNPHPGTIYIQNGRKLIAR